MPVGPRQLLRFGPFEFDPECGQIRKNSTGLKLQGQPIQILEILLERPGELVTREELRQRLWTSDTFVDFDHSLNTAIKKLRQALGDDADTPRYIETLPKRGYRFIGEIDRGKGAQEIRERRSVAVAVPEDGRPLLVNAKHSRGWKWAAGTAALALVIVAIYHVVKPTPMPRIVASRALTKTGHRKTSFQSRLVNDGTNLYFQEERLSRVITMRVPLVGGETSEVAIPGENWGLRDISKDGSQLLLSISDSKTDGSDLWTQPLPAGPARMIVKDAGWAVWGLEDRSILFARNNTDVYRVSADGTDLRYLVGFPHISGFGLSPDGRRMRVGVTPTRALWEANSDGTNPHAILAEHKDSVAIGDWSPDGKYFFFLSWDGDRFNLWATSEERHWWKASTPVPQQLTFGPSWIAMPALSRDGKHVYAVGREPHGELSIYDPKADKFVPYLSGISACYTDFSRDGQWIAYVSYPEGTLWRSRVDGSERRQLTVPPLAVMNPSWSPDGRLIAFTELSGGDRRHLPSKRRIYVVSTEGGAPMLLLGGDQSVFDPTWSPDGTAIAYSAGGGSAGPSAGVMIYDLHTEKSTKVPASDGYWSPRWSPDGKYLVALAGTTSKLVLFSFVTREWQELDSREFSWPNWSPDSKFIYGLEGSNFLVRIARSDHRKEMITSTVGFPTTAYLMDRWGFPWFGVTPDGRPIATRDTGLEEIYSFDLEYK